MVVLDVDGSAQGYISWQKNGCIGKDYVNKLVVSEPCRHQGMAKRLIEALSTVLTGRVFISAPAGNMTALNLLESTQWTRAGKIIGLLPLGEAEIFFFRDLSDAPLP